VKILPSSIAALLYLIVGIAFADALADRPTLSRSDIAADIRRGYQASARCIQGGERPTEWCRSFQRLRKGPSSDPFLLGANFGFSFRAETSAEGVGATQDELRMVAMQAASARVTFEAHKANLRLTDSDVVSILGINLLQFAAWKARVETADQDRSVVKGKSGLDL
jgi:hypothetical protein